MDMKFLFKGDPERYEKVNAIKGFRRLTGSGLKESKEFIESVVENGPIRFSFPPPPPLQGVSSPALMDEGLAMLKSAMFVVTGDFDNEGKRDKVLNELKKLIKMAVENDQNDIAIELLSLRDNLT